MSNLFQVVSSRSRLKWNTFNISRLLQKNFIIAVLIIIVMCIYHICGTNNEHKSEYKYLIKFVGNRRVDIIIKFVLPVIPDQRLTQFKGFVFWLVNDYREIVVFFDDIRLGIYDPPIPGPPPFLTTPTRPASIQFGMRSSLLIEILTGTHVRSRKLATYPNNIKRGSGIGIPEAWMPTIEKHNNRKTEQQWTTEGTATCQNNETMWRLKRTNRNWP